MTPQEVRRPFPQPSLTVFVILQVLDILTTLMGIALAFFPAQQITALFSYEVWMFGGTLAFIGLAAFFFFIYGRRKAARKLASAASTV